MLRNTIRLASIAAATVGLGLALSLGGVHARESLSALRADVNQNTQDILDLQDAVPPPGGTVFRWNVFSTYGNNIGGGWVMDNRSELFGGVHPSQWTDGNYRAVNMSADPDVLRSLLTRRGTAGSNAMIYSRVYWQYSSTEGRVVVALFRVRNSTASDILWSPYFYYTCFSGWSERAGVAVDGDEVWHSGGTNCGTNQNTNISINIPANGTSTVIFSSPSSNAWGNHAGMHLRFVGLAFWNHSLDLPVGLEFVDDLDQQEAPLW